MENTLPPDALPRVWVIDSARAPLSQLGDALAGAAEVNYFPPGAEPDWASPPDAVFFSAEIPDGAAGAAFSLLINEAGGIPLLAVSRLRSYGQALAFFRAGAADFLSLPLTADEIRDRLDAALDRAAGLALQGAVVEIEHLDGEEDTGEVSLLVRSAALAGKSAGAEGAEDEAATAEAELVAMEAETIAGNVTTAEGEAEPVTAEEELVTVEGLPVPELWEELPCGLVLFDSSGEPVFSNGLALELFGHSSLSELRTALENNLSAFAAHSANNKPLPDNHWPHVQAWKTRTARSAVLSVEKPDRRRAWLRIDCLPHLADGKIARLAMTVVNLTGELPAIKSIATGPTSPAAAPSPAPPAKRDRGKSRGRRKK